MENRLHWFVRNGKQKRRLRGKKHTWKNDKSHLTSCTDWTDKEHQRTTPDAGCQEQGEEWEEGEGLGSEATYKVDVGDEDCGIEDLDREVGDDGPDKLGEGAIQLGLSLSAGERAGDDEEGDEHLAQQDGAQQRKEDEGN